MPARQAEMSMIAKSQASALLVDRWVLDVGEERIQGLGPHLMIHAHQWREGGRAKLGVKGVDIRPEALRTVEGTGISTATEAVGGQGV